MRVRPYYAAGWGMTLSSERFVAYDAGPRAVIDDPERNDDSQQSYH